MRCSGKATSFYLGPTLFERGRRPSTLELVLAIRSTSPKKACIRASESLVAVGCFSEPRVYKAQAMRLSTYNKPRVVACAEDLPHHLGLPRGCLDDVRQMP
jgi:hypothetical protein